MKVRSGRSHESVGPVAVCSNTTLKRSTGDGGCLTTREGNRYTRRAGLMKPEGERQGEGGRSTLTCHRSVYTPIRHIHQGDGHR